MKVTFKERVPVETTMMFDEVYEESLQLDIDEKTELLTKAASVYLLVDGELAGETYSIPVRMLDEDIEDTDGGDYWAYYCYSTTILPKFQGQGLSKLLVAYATGNLTGGGCTQVIGHATSPQMVAVRKFFGAHFTGAVHENWYDTDRTAFFYRQYL